MLTPHPLTLKLKLPNFNNKTLSEANASLFFYWLCHNKWLIFDEK